MSQRLETGVHRKLIGVYLQFAVALALWFFLSWFLNHFNPESLALAGFMRPRAIPRGVCRRPALAGP